MVNNKVYFRPSSGQLPLNIYCFWRCDITILQTLIQFFHFFYLNQYDYFYLMSMHNNIFRSSDMLLRVSKYLINYEY